MMKKKFLSAIMGLTVFSAAFTAAPLHVAAANFNPSYYAQTYEDVRNAFGTDAAALYNHYITCGMREGRLPYEGGTPGEAVDGIEDTQTQEPAAALRFDPDFYARTYEDVRNVFGTDAAALYNHYITCGMREGRLPYAGAVPGADVTATGLGTEVTTNAPATNSPKINITVDKWENITPNKISTSIIGESAIWHEADLAVPIRITMEVPAMQQKEYLTLSCRAIVTATLPAGMDYNKDSLHVYVNNTRVPQTAYTISVTGQEIRVTLNGINRYPFKCEEGDELVVSFFSVMNGSAGYENKITASVQYDYGTFTRKWTGAYQETYHVYVCQFCGFRAGTQSEVSDHQIRFISPDPASISHAAARGLVYDYADPIYEESAFIVEAGYTLQSESDTAIVYLE